MVNSNIIGKEQPDTLEEKVLLSKKNHGMALRTSHLHGLQAIIDEAMMLHFTDNDLDSTYFTGPDEIHLVLQDILTDLGYGHLYLETLREEDIISKVQKIMAHTTKNWTNTLQKVQLQDNMAKKTIEAHILAIDKPVLGERSFQTVLLQYLLKTIQEPLDFTLDTTLKVTEYTLDKKEFWLLKGRIITAAKLYEQSFLNHPTFESFHPVLFDMLTPKEAQNIIHDQLQSAICALRESKFQLQSVLIEYKSILSRQYLELIESMIKKYVDIKYEIEQLKLDEKNASRDNLITKWVIKNPFTPRKTQLIRKYQQLRSEWGQTIFNKAIPFPNYEQYDRLVAEIQDLPIEQFDWAEFIQKHIFHHMERLTIKNGLAPFLSSDIVHELNNRIHATLDEINSNKIFRQATEDNTLYLQNRLHFLDKTIRTWEDILSQIAKIERYHAWRKFWDQQDAGIKNIVLALSKFDKKQWIHQFETWYFRLLIEKNKSPNILSEFKAIAHLTQTTHRRINAFRLSSQDSKVKQFKRGFTQLCQSNPLIRKWKNQNFPTGLLDSQSRDQVAQLFPIRSKYNLHPFKIPDSSFVINIELTDNQYSIQCSKGMHETDKKQPETTKVDYHIPPLIKKSIVLSQHSDRWESIKEISHYLISQYPNLAFFESKECIILSLYDHALVQKLILSLKDISLSKHRTAYNESMQRSLSEALLNNNRDLYYVTLDGSIQNTQHIAGYLSDHKTTQLLNHAGIKPIDIWTKNITIWHEFNQNNPFSIVDLQEGNTPKQIDQKPISNIIRN